MALGGVRLFPTYVLAMNVLVHVGVVRCWCEGDSSRWRVEFA